MKVVLIDMSGVKIDGKDVSRVVACEVLGGDCNHNGKTAQINCNGAKKSRSDELMDVRKDKLLKMDEAIKSYGGGGVVPLSRALIYLHRTQDVDCR